MKNLKKLFLLILLSSFSANFSAFGMNNDSESEGEKQGTKRKFDETEQVVEQEEKINKIELSKDILDPMNDILNYEDVMGLIFSKLNTKDLLPIRLANKNLNSLVNNFIIRERYCLTEKPNQMELRYIKHFNDYLKKQGNLLVQKYFALLGNFKISEFKDIILNRIADTVIDTNDSEALLIMASANGRLQLVQKLLSHGADVNAARNDGITPLYIAAERGHLDVVQFLIANGADVNAARNDGTTPLWIAARNDGTTPLYIAAENGHLEIVRVLLTNGADVNAARNDDTTPLLRAAERGHFEVVQFLITKGANINAARNDGTTPLHMATKSGWDSKIKVIKELLNCGADVSIADKNGAKPLAYAKDYATAKIFLNHHNFSVNAELVENTGFTCLHIAASCSEIKYLKKLLEKTDIDVNANFNAEKFSRRVDVTPLYIAAQVDNIKVVQLLLNHPNIIVRQQDLAITNLKPEIKDLLQKKLDEQQN